MDPALAALLVAGLFVLVGVLAFAMRRSPGAGERGPEIDPRPRPAPGPASRARVPPMPELQFRIVVAGQEEPDPSLRPVDLESCWAPPGASVDLGSWRMPDGMIFALRDRTSRASVEEASLIEPRLPVAAVGTRDAAAQMGYWARYSRIAPAARTEYLDWLAAGRSDASVQIGCVFLFFYGIERRLIIDAPASQTARREVPALVAELDRLLGIYQGNSSFRGYANTLRTHAATVFLDGGTPPQAPEFEQPPTYEDLNDRVLRTSIALARLVRDGRPINASWALAWYLATQFGLRTPAHRCWREFQALFVERYTAEYGEGMIIPPNRSRLRIAYHPASPSLAGATSELTLPGAELPDVMRLSRPVRDIAAIVTACTDELDAYSRWLGRNDATASPLRALAFLPPTLVASQGATASAALIATLDRALAGAPRAKLPATELFKHWAPDKGTRMSKKDATLFGQLLDKLGYGVEPDVRFGGPPLEEGDGVVVFHADVAAPSPPTPSYRSAGILLHVAAAVANADGEVAAAEEQALEAQLDAIKALGPAERTRLAAHVQWLLSSGASLRGIQKRLESLEPPARRQIAKFAVAVAGADGRIHPKEVKTLEKIYVALALPKSDLFDDLHEMTTSSSPAATEPVVVRAGRADDAGFRLPSAPKSGGPGDGVQLDMSRVRAKLAETAAVSELLAGIFVDPDGEGPETDDADADADVDDAGAAQTLPQPGVLDASHTAFLAALAAKTSWSAAELEALAAANSLLPDGALDVINEAALDRCDEPALEGTDPIEVNLQIAQELLR